MSSWLTRPCVDSGCEPLSHLTSGVGPAYGGLGAAAWPAAPGMATVRASAAAPARRQGRELGRRMPTPSAPDVRFLPPIPRDGEVILSERHQTARAREGSGDAARPVEISRVRPAWPSCAARPA